jgi:nucleotide-binding universal stress UspA family protein
MYKKILVPYDMSEHAHHALEAAYNLCAGGSDAVSITILNVSDMMEIDDASFALAVRVAGIPPISDDTAHEARVKYFDQAKEAVEKDIAENKLEAPSNVTVEVKVVGGHPQEVIADYAKDNGFDCIVMGRRGLGGIRGALGSVSYAILHTVELPVLVVK